MILKKLRLVNFRNHRDLEIAFPKTTIILGPNASGKTNLLEAIYLLSTTKSFRTNQNENLIFWGAPFAKAEGEIEDRKRTINLEFFLNFDKETLKVKKEGRLEKNQKSLLSLLGIFLAVLFAPETLSLVVGSPFLRRRSLDLLLSLTSKKYAQNYLQFLSILKQRNKLLFLIKEGKAKSSELDFWDQGFSKMASFLQQEREKAIQNFNIFLPASLRLFYLPSPKEGLEKVLKNQREKEIEAGFTLFGPQKDDFSFFLNQKSLSSFGSRGEIREAAISFKLAELSFLKEKTDTTPVLLLDDLFSELDRQRRKKLLPAVFKEQTILTTTSLSSLDQEIIKKSKVIELK